MQELLKLLEKVELSIRNGEWNTLNMEEMSSLYDDIVKAKEKYLDSNEELLYKDTLYYMKKIEFIRNYIEARQEKSAFRRMDDLGRIVIPKKLRRIIGNGNSELDGKEFDIQIIYDEETNQFGCQIFCIGLSNENILKNINE